MSKKKSSKNNSKNSGNSENRAPTKPYKIDAFETFITLVESGVPVTSWGSIANDLGVSEDTITNWKKTDRYKMARTTVLRNVISKMVEVGYMDWRMWDRYNKLLGIDAVEKHDLTTNGKDIVPILGGVTNVSEDNSNKQTTPTEETT